MIDLVITLADMSQYRKSFENKILSETFLAKLELFEGLFLDLSIEGKRIRINPRFIVKVEEEIQSVIV